MNKVKAVHQSITASKSIQFLIKYKKHIFPVIIFLLILVLVICKISGTSIGVYDSYLYGPGHKDSSLIYGKPQPIRSDEWLVSTQLTIAQEKNGFKEINKNFVGDKDMSIIVDVPYLDWSMIFKPQNLAFFIIPFEYAFAFKWWILLLILILSAYYFTLRLLPGKTLIASLLSIVISFSPFVFWWYQTATIAPLAYGFLILIISMSIIDDEQLKIFGKRISKRITVGLRIAGLSYLLVSFALILYPPFQIPVAISVFFFLVGYSLQNKAFLTKKRLLKIGLTFITTIVIVSSLCGAFVLSRQDAVSSVIHTVYPGSRDIKSGGYSFNQLLVPYLQPQIQRGAHGSKYIKNQSESAAFILTPVFLLLPAIGLAVWLYTYKKKTDLVLIFLIICTLLFISQLFIPGINNLSRLFALNIVPLERLQIGLGFIAIPLLATMIKVMLEYKLKMSPKIKVAIISYLALSLIVMVVAGLQIMNLYPDFISSKKLLMGLVLLFFAGIAFILLKRLTLGLIFVALLSIVSVIDINPLYVGLGPIYNSKISQVIEKSSDKDATWAAAQDILIENFPQMSSRKAVTGVAAYPDSNFWKSVSDEKHSYVYNRYAHTILWINDSDSITLIAPDFFGVSSSCNQKIAGYIDYVVSTKKLDGSCYNLINSVSYPNVTFYVYKHWR